MAQPSTIIKKRSPTKRARASTPNKHTTKHIRVLQAQILHLSQTLLPLLEGQLVALKDENKSLNERIGELVGTGQGSNGSAVEMVVVGGKQKRRQMATLNDRENGGVGGVGGAEERSTAEGVGVEGKIEDDGRVG